MARRLLVTIAALVVPLALASVSRASSPGETLLSGRGDQAGYHVSVGRVAGTGRFVRWRDVAILDPAGLQERSWTGNQCESADGRLAAVVVLPAFEADDPSALAAGADAYAVNLATGRVRLLSRHARMGYDTPSCGAGDTAVFTAFDGADERSTAVTLVDLASGVAQTRSVSGELTSPVPFAGGVVAARGSQLVRVQLEARSTARPAVSVLGRVPGIPYDLRSLDSRTIDFLQTEPGAERAGVWQLRSGRLQRVGSGLRTELSLVQAGDRAVLTGNAVLGGATGLVRAGVSPVVQATSASADGRLLVAPATDRIARTVGVWRTSGSFVPATWSTSEPARTLQPLPSAGAARLATAASAQQPVCAVPRLDPTREAPQPNAAQVGWASQMAEQGLLTGGLGRPAGFDEMGTAAYAANQDFPPIALDHPSGGSWDTVPRSVFDAIMAQESNWSQASWHALPGIAGDPLIADYYGNGANAIDTIDYAQADCGYGVSQVTDGMRAGDGLFTSAEQARIAVDYVENIAAGLRILEQTWNELYQDGILANGGDPRYLKNWYFAAWAYNTGIEPNAAHGNTRGCEPGPSCTGPDGTWGLGWANNPANPAYPPNRSPYLKTTYADAAHPADWPYQERIMGWMGSPLVQYGSADYAGPDYNGSTWLNLPSNGSFCSGTNDCSGAGAGTPGNCALGDSECWWHGSATWVDCAAKCATSSYTSGAGSSEPGIADPHPPTCSSDLSAGVHGPPVIVDEESGPPVDLAGCGASNWQNAGSFAYSFGIDAAGDPIGAVDSHQLGIGFGGHVLFTHSEDGSNPALINSGAWTPSLPGTQYYDVKVHVPVSGHPQIPDATYTINSNGYGGPWVVTISQDVSNNTWLDLGQFPLAPGATVTLTNRSEKIADASDPPDVIFDAAAFIPEGGSPDRSAPPPPSSQPGCSSTATIGSLQAIATCFRRSGARYVSVGVVRIGGVDLTPAAGASISLDPSTIRISLSGTVEVAVGSIDLASLRNLNIAAAHAWTFTAGASANIKGLPVKGDVTIKFTGASAQITLNAALNALGGVTGVAQLKATNADGLQTSSLAFDVSRADLAAITLRNIRVAYARTAGGDEWSGGATVDLPFPEVRSVAGTVSLLNGRFENATATVSTDIPVAEGVFLKQLRAQLALSPSFSFGGGVTLTAGPSVDGVSAASLAGDFKYQSAARSQPAAFDVSGNLILVDKLSLSHGSLSLNSLGAIKFSGELDLDFDGTGFQGSVAGSIDGSRSMQASASGALEVGGHRLSGQAVLSTKGIGVCGELNLLGRHSVGFGFQWSQFPEPEIELTGCDLGEWSIAGSTAAAASNRRIDLPAHLPFVAFRARSGGNGSPVLAARDPGGATIAPPAGSSFVNSAAYFYLRDPGNGYTYLIVPRPAPGIWIISSTGPTPSSTISTAVAYGLRPPLVRASVVRRRSAWFLRYRVARQPGQEVDFYDSVGVGSRLITRSTSTGGQLRFSPLKSSGREHAILAVVTRSGLPRERITVTSFFSSVLRAPRRVAGLSAAYRQGSLLIRWKDQQGVDGYLMSVTLADGRDLELRESARTRGVWVRSVRAHEGFRVTIAAVGAGGLNGPVATVR